MGKPKPKVGQIEYRTMTVERDGLATRAEGDTRIPVALSSETPVERFFGREILVHTREAVNMEYAADGLPFLADHDTTRQLGLVEDVHLRGDGKLGGMLRQGNHPDAAWYFRDIEEGIRPNLSIGYRIDAMEPDPEDKETYRATRWTPMEGSTVSVPADITVGVGRSAEQKPVEIVTQVQVAPETPVETRATTHHEEKDMSEETAPAHKPGIVAVSLEDQRKSVADISRLGVECGMADKVAGWLERGLNVDQVKAEIFDAKVKGAQSASPAGHLDLSPRDAQRFSYTRAIGNLIHKRWEDKGGFEKEVSDAVAKRTNRATSGFFIPLDLPVMTDRAAVTGNIVATSSLGGAGVQTTLLPLIDLLRNKMLVRRLGATVLGGLTGNISFPRHIVANTMAWEGENPSTPHAGTAATFDNVTLSPKTAMATSAYSRQLLIQESFDVASFIQMDLATVLALGLDLAALDGTGSGNQPTGIMRQTGVTTITHGTTDGAIPTWADMVSYETNVATNNADIGTISWVTAPSMRGKLKTVLKSTTAGSTYIWEQDQTINGYQAYATSQMPTNYTRGTSTTVAVGIVFGVWSELLIGEWGGALEVVVDPYSLAQQGMVQITQMILADIAVRHPKAFCQSKSALVA